MLQLRVWFAWLNFRLKAEPETRPKMRWDQNTWPKGHFCYDRHILVSDIGAHLGVLRKRLLHGGPFD